MQYQHVKDARVLFSSYIPRENTYLNQENAQF